MSKNSFLQLILSSLTMYTISHQLKHIKPHYTPLYFFGAIFVSVIFNTMIYINHDFYKLYYGIVVIFVIEIVIGFFVFIGMLLFSAIMTLSNLKVDIRESLYITMFSFSLFIYVLFTIVGYIFMIIAGLEESDITLELIYNAQNRIESLKYLIYFTFVPCIYLLIQNFRKFKKESLQ